MDLAFAADDSGTAVTTGKNVLPDYPDENPTKSALKAWLDAWRDELRATGYSSLLRGEEPYAMAKLAPRPLISVETGTIPDSIRAENARIEHQNALNLIEKEGQLRELQRSFWEDAIADEMANMERHGSCGSFAATVTVERRLLAFGTRRRYRC